MYRVAFSGYRPDKLPFFGDDDPLFTDFLNRIRTQLKKLIEEGADSFISGMAVGCDTYCAELVLELQKQYPNIKLTAAVPCADQASRWSKAQQEHYYELLKKCSEKVVLADHYYNGCMQKRNRYMVDNCDVLLAIFDGKPGGTMNTVNYAKSIGKKMIIIPPSL